MSILSVYSVSTPDLPNKVLTHFEDIAATLAEHGVRFERRPLQASVQAGAGQDEVLQALAAVLDPLMSEWGTPHADVISLDRDHPQRQQWREKFLDEHSHAGREVRYFVAGRGLLSLHIEGYVYAVQCEKHDVIAVPAGMARWFDMGEAPRLIVIRLFEQPQDQAAQYTGTELARCFPGLDT
ncbi:acireductone dioxygenase [Pseudomonas sp.]|uniref:1,2-dihydroxy-3-keto-5-methylthiopentene dioxygenase n=1 Tax=Pseudomonas sp. TaxID=306 RepID=UPI00258F68DB|nr:acireductone dioxygenase [Pseudomonas sp.]